MERNASLAAHIAIALSRSSPNIPSSQYTRQEKKGKLTSSPTYSIFSVGRKEMGEGVECVILDMMQDLLREDIR